MTHYLHASLDALPIGRCTSCRKPAQDFEAINMRCDTCNGIVASTAVQDWQPCPPCLGTGKSLIWPAHGDDCPVCQGSGHIMRADIGNASDEMEAVLDAFAATGDYVPWPPEPAMFCVSKLGSFSMLRFPLPRGYSVKTLRDAVQDVADAFDADEAERRRLAKVTEQIIAFYRDERDRDLADPAEAGPMIGVAATRSAPR